MRRRFAVERNDRPLVIKGTSFVRSEVEHRLDGEAISRSDLFASALPPVIRDLRSLVHRTADAVARVIAYQPIPVLFGVLLNGPADVADAVIHPALLDTEREAFVGHPDQLSQLVADLADRNGRRRIADESLV